MSVGVVDYPTLFARKGPGSGDEITLINKTSPIDRPETVRFATKRISDIYKGTGISISMQAPIKTGTQVLVSVKGISETTNSETGARYLAPYSAHEVFVFPDDPAFAAALRLEVQSRLQALSLKVSGAAVDAISSRLMEMAMGAILPAGL